MIGFKDSARLAYTKYRTRKVRSIMFAITASMFFGIICFLSIISTGFLQSVKPYTTHGYGSRYITSADISTDYEKLNKRAFEFTLERYEKAKADAKAKGEPEPERPSEGSSDQKDFNRAQNELYPPTELAAYKKSIERFNPIAAYENRGSYDTEFHFIRDGKEVGDSQSASQNGYSFSPFGGTSSAASVLEAPVVSAYSSSLIEPFLYEGQNLNQESVAIPALLPADMAAALVGVKFDNSLKADQKVAAFNELQSKLMGKTVDICMRNQTAVDTLTLANEQKKQIEANKNSSSYTPPLVQYAVPAASCTPVTIAKDDRTPQQKEADLTAEKKLPTATTKQYSLKVVGFVSGSMEDGTGSFLNNIFNSGPRGTVILPIEVIKNDPYLTSVFLTNQSSQQLLAEFKNRQEQKAYIDTTCVPEFSFTSDGSYGSVYANCIAKNQLYSINNFGNNAVTLEDFRTTFVNKIIKVAIIVVFIIAGLSMMGTMSKIVADSRRETGVFRALGAKRLDIAQIYYTYAAIIALISVGIAVIVGSLIAAWLSSKYGGSLTKNAVTTFARYDGNDAISLIGFNLKQLFTIAAAAVLSAWVGATIPILRNIGRHPIKAMREE